MTQKMRDDEFDALLGRALSMEAAPVSLERRVLNARHDGFWFLVLVSPGRLAASAAILSLLIGFVLGWSNTIVAEDQGLDMSAVLYAANDAGGF